MGGRPTAEAAQALWYALRAVPDGLTPQAAAAASGASEPYARKTMRSWANAGFAERDGSRYRLPEDAAEAPPVVRLNGAVEPREGTMAARDFASIHQASGISTASLSRLLRLRDATSRGVLKMASGEWPIDGRTAKAMRLLDEIARLYGEQG